MKRRTQSIPLPSTNTPRRHRACPAVMWARPPTEELVAEAAAKAAAAKEKAKPRNCGGVHYYVADRAVAAARGGSKGAPKRGRGRLRVSEVTLATQISRDR